MEGILGHIYYVREGVWRRKIDANKRAHVEKTKDKAEHNELSATGELYRKFLFYRRFVCPEMPVIIGEGKTDNAYLRAAMRKLAPAFPSLMDKTSGLRKVQLFNYSRVSNEVLRLGGGSDHLKNFICNYAKNMSAYKAIIPTKPVIVIIDNDKGANGIFGYMQNHKPKPSLTSTEPFYHIGYNLYLVKTPEIGAFSCMEDLFPTDILETKLNGKTFNISNTECTETQYGKHAFAENVVKPKIDTIDFSGFTPLLERIAAAIAHHTPSPP
jgi:RNA-directed DNA polymerase